MVGFFVLLFDSQRFTGLLAEKTANSEVKAATISNILKAFLSKYEEIIPKWHTEI